MTKKQLFVDVFRHNVRCIFRSRDLDDLEVAPAEAILNPEVSHGQVTNPAEASPPADAYCCRRVGVQPQGDLHAEVIAQRL